jgi:H+/gluconate symporter-like permease
MSVFDDLSAIGVVPVVSIEDASDSLPFADLQAMHRMIMRLVAASIVMASGVNQIAAVFAICLGSFIAILPNDSYYWLVRRDALEGQPSEGRVIRILTGGAILQVLVGMAVLLIGVTL